MIGGSGIVVKAVLDTFSEAISAIKEVSLEKEMQQSQRTLIREQSRVLIAQIESNTEILRDAIAKDHELHMKIIDTIGAMLIGKDIIDTSVIEACRTLLLPSLNTSPMLQTTISNSSRLTTKNNLMLE